MTRPGTASVPAFPKPYGSAITPVPTQVLTSETVAVLMPTPDRVVGGSSSRGSPSKGVFFEEDDGSTADMMKSRAAWNTPCDMAKNLNQCEIMRDPPSRDKDGKLTYADHGSRCMWRPLEVEDYADDGKPRCAPRIDYPYKSKPLTKEELLSIQARVGDTDTHIKALTDLKTPYGQPRQISTTELRDLESAVVTLPLIPTRSTLGKLSQGLEKQGVTLRDFPDTPDWTSMYWKEEGELSDAEYLKSINKKCEDPNGVVPVEDYPWDPDQWKSLDNDIVSMASWLVPQTIAKASDDETTHESRLKKSIAAAAKSTWWVLAKHNLEQQDLWLQSIHVLARKRERQLRDPEKRKELEMTLAPVIDVEAGQDKAFVDLTFAADDDKISTRVFTPNPALVDPKAFKTFVDANPQRLHKVPVSVTQGQAGVLPATTTGTEKLYTRLKKEPLLRIQKVEGDTVRTIDGKKKPSWKGTAYKLALILWLSSMEPPAKSQQEAQRLRSLYRRGIGGHKWRTNLTGTVKVVSPDTFLSQSEQTHRQTIMRQIRKLKRQELGERLNDMLVGEKSENRQNRATLTYFATLNAEDNVEERYRLAIAQIPKWLQYNFAHDKIIDFTKDEIKRRFRSWPGHPLYYNRSGGAGDDDLHVEAARKLVDLAQDMVNKQAETVKDKTDYAALRKVLEVYRDELKQSLQNKISHPDLKTAYARDFNAKFGSKAYVDPITGASTDMLMSLQKLAR